jgi:iron-sulfur cluster insertion protein
LIKLTDSAKNKITEILKEENDESLSLRVFVQGGGCSGFQYGFSIDNEQNEDDIVVEVGSLKVLVDFISSQYLTNSEIDYVEDLNGSTFNIKNPNAQTTCGCGSSFSV